MKLVHALVLCKLFLAYQSLNCWYKVRVAPLIMYALKKSVFDFHTTAIPNANDIKKQN